ncbi:8022_t:CDS:10, partial [Ambispora gerdemannii]
EIQDKYNVKISFLLEKQTFELRGMVHDKLDEARKEVQRILLDQGPSVKQISMIPPLRKRIDILEEIPPMNLRPLNEAEFEKCQFEEDTEELEKSFFIDDRVTDIHDFLGVKNEANQNSDYWREICKDCGVLRPLFKTQTIPLVHYPNQNVDFKLLFYPLKQHAYFKDKFGAVKVKEPYILIAVRKNAAGEYNELPNELDIRVLPQNKVPAISKSSVQSNIKNAMPQSPVKKEQQTQVKTGTSSAPEFSSSNFPDLLANKTVPPNNTQRPISYREQSLERPSNTQQNSVNDDFKHPNFSQLQDREEIQQSSRSNEPNNRPLKTEEEKQARKEAKKARIAKMKYEHTQEALNNANSNNKNIVENIISPSSNTRVLVENEVEKKSNEETELKPKIKKIVMEKSPDTSGPFDYQQITFGKRVRNYNFEQMKKVFTEAFDYARSHKGEIRFHGSVGKVVFSKVTPQISPELWEFTDLKDILVRELGVLPAFTDSVTEDSRLIQLLYENLSVEPSTKTAFFEINANSRNNPHGDYIPVTMFVNCNYVALGKVTLRWKHLADVDWSVLDRKFDFQMSLKARKSIRHDVKPFTTFMKKTSVHPASRMITFENIPEFLKVTSISFKQVNKFKIHYPFIVEVTRVEEIPIKQQMKSNKWQGGTGRGKPYYTVEVINDSIREKVKSNMDLGAGKLGNWTVEDILGEEPGMTNLVELTKTMLMLIERCHIVAERRAKEEANKAKK